MVGSLVDALADMANMCRGGRCVGETQFAFGRGRLFRWFGRGIERVQHVGARGIAQEANAVHVTYEAAEWRKDRVGLGRRSDVN